MAPGFVFGIRSAHHSTNIIKSSWAVCIFLPWLNKANRHILCCAA